MNISVLSDGGWGTALALHLLTLGHHVTLWGPFPDYIEEMRSSRENSRFLRGVALPATLNLETTLATACVGREMLVLAAPSQFMGGLLTQLQRVKLAPETIVVNVAKGIEIKSLKRMDELVAEALGATQPFVVLSGPSHAEEVSRGVPTAVVAASTGSATATAVQRAFMGPAFRVYTSDDVIGVELGGSLKNVLAIAAGILDGMGGGDNPKAALMTRGIAELARLGKALGGQPQTFFGLSGIGDLIVTCTSRHSRNRHVGEELGRGRTLGEIQAEMGMVVAEGVATAESAFRLATKVGVDVPLIAAVHAVLYEDKSPRHALHELMTRDPKPEYPEGFLSS